MQCFQRSVADMKLVLVWICFWGLSTTLSVPASSLDWHDAGGFRWADLTVPAVGRTGFQRMTPEQTGLSFTNTLGEWEGAANRVLFNGSGVALGDFDRDGLPDIFICGMDTPNALYRNLGGWKFENVTRESGLNFAGKFYRGAVFADLNGDNWLDLLVSTTGQGVLCFLNDGHGRFRDVSAAAGTVSQHGSVTLALADIDGNGTLDLYIANNRADDIRDRGKVDIYMSRDRQYVIPPALTNRLVVTQGRVLEYGEPDQLLLNDGHGVFTEVPWTQGAFLDEDGQPLTTVPMDWTLTVTFRDVNDDGAPDIYLCNDYWSPDRLWINDGKGRFRAIDRLAIRHTSASSMGVDFADIDRDGYLDFFVLDMLSRDARLRKRQMLAQTPMTAGVGVIDDRPQIMRNTLFHNRGDGTFRELADYAGLPASEWSWSPMFIDVDLDGYQDLLIPAGHTKDVQDLDAAAAIQARQRSYASITDPAERQRAFTTDKMLNARLYPELEMPVVAFRNRGDLTFEETTSFWGTDDLATHHGIAMADLDGDGDLDVVVNNLGRAVGVYRNESTAPRVAVRLKGLPPNTQGIGARVRFLHGAVPLQSEEVIAGGRYLSGADPQLAFACGNQTQGMKLEVHWRSGKTSIVSDIRPNRIYEINEEFAETPETSAPSTSPPAFFEDVSSRLAHTHVDELFNDFERQPLLPRKLSQLGPGVAWYDVNGDRHDDLIIGGGKGGRLALFLGDGKGGFKRDESNPFNTPITRDQTAVLAWTKSPGHNLILTGASNYEDGLPLGAGARQYDLRSRTLEDPIPAMDSSTGPMAMADVDGDGDLDLFVGGRVLPGQWPMAATSRLFRNDGGKWVLDTARSAPFLSLGLVTAALFSDLDGDGRPDLILACEWGPIRLFQNVKGVFQDVTERWGLAEFTGWWNGLAAGDFDGDGRLDLVAANWGLNSSYRATAAHPVQVYYTDTAGSGYLDIIEAEFDPAINTVSTRRMRDPLAASMPWIVERFPTHQAFAEASIPELLGDEFKRAKVVEANTLASMVFLNRGGKFEGRPLPREAQFTAAFGVVVSDFDGDGHEDIFLSQNFFGVEAGTPRQNAGRGLWLKGDGTGEFEAVAAHEAGIMVYGEQRGVAAADFNEDGRMDLVVTQNGAATRLFENRLATKGLRVIMQALPVTRRPLVPSSGLRSARSLARHARSGLAGVIGPRTVPFRS
jgi:enediyne biosynthesis protein E4